MVTMPEGTRHIGVRIRRPHQDVYRYVSDPSNLPAWAPGLGSEIERDGDDWYVDSPMGRVRLRFAPENAYGILDHEVTLPTGETFHNPMRAIADGDDATEVVFSVRRFGDVSDADFDRDAGLVAADLARLKSLLE